MPDWEPFCSYRVILSSVERHPNPQENDSASRKKKKISNKSTVHKPGLRTPGSSFSIENSPNSLIAFDASSHSKKAKSLLHRAGQGVNESPEHPTHSESDESTCANGSTSQYEEDVGASQSPTTSARTAEELRRKKVVDDCNGMHDKFSMIRETLLFHGWKVFTQPLPKYNEALVREFYALHVAAMPKMKKGLKEGMLDVVKVRDVDVPCGPT
ncbi:hypothetical protein HAX54_015418 [Datura stramonium]|uniref:Uncharacterized protein n=1 Tax=Datura stramonium TaxID=4076 RepID=A0ABS8TRW8_DATST|nr:hypothetical protein [Datura stramonium]